MYHVYSDVLITLSEIPLEMSCCEGSDNLSTWNNEDVKVKQEPIEGVTVKSGEFPSGPESEDAPSVSKDVCVAAQLQTVTMVTQSGKL